MEVLDFQRMVQSFSDKKIKTYCQYDTRNQEVIVIVQFVDEFGSIMVHERREFEVKEIEMQTAIESMYFIRSMITEVSSLAS